MTEDVKRPEPTPSGAPPGGEDERPPLGQQLFDRPILLLIAAIVVMFVFFTGWGWFEMATLPQAPLP